MIFSVILQQISILLFLLFGHGFSQADDISCPSPELILPCRCSEKGKEMQIWCSHSNLPQVLEGIKSVARSINRSIDEVILENNYLPALPGRIFASLKIIRLMLRHNNIQRLSTGWLNALEDTLVEIFIVERNLRSIPVECLTGFNKLEAITIQSEDLKRLPDFNGLLSLKYLSCQSLSLIELQPQFFKNLSKLESVYINGASGLVRIEAGLFENLQSLTYLDLSKNGINWIHIRAFYGLPRLATLKLSANQINDAGMVGRVIKDLGQLQSLKLDKNIIDTLRKGSFVDLPSLRELYLNDNIIAELQYGSFHRTPGLRIILLHNNRIRRIHPESFLQSSGGGVESIYIQNNEIERVDELRSLLDALPTLKYLDMSNNFLRDIPFGALRGHATLEQLHLNSNLIQMVERDALMAMPGLRQLRLCNNSLTDELPMPFWNLPALKGLDLSLNRFQRVDSTLLAGLPNLRLLDLSQNFLIHLDPKIFLHTPMLETLNISFNEIQSITPNTFASLSRLFEIDASHNKLSDMISGLPKIVERISIRYNNIKRFSLSASNALNLPNLRMLDLSENSLEDIPKFALQSLHRLRVLSLAHNRLQNVYESTFEGISRLEKVQLQYNHISEIQEGSFRSMNDLHDLNLRGNKIETLATDIFKNSTAIEFLDISQNSLHDFNPSMFNRLEKLKFLDLSGNSLLEIPASVSKLSNLVELDLSFNRLARLPQAIFTAMKSIVEIRLSNNQLVELKAGSFRNLPELQYVDLSSNELSSIEPSAIKNLPNLHELVLADNKLIEIKDRVFEDLPDLQAAHLQHNLLRYVSPNSFYNSPSLVYLNLSANHFRTMDSIGLRNMRGLEVLDLSHNNMRAVTSMPLQSLNWLVELKMDNNEICKIQGEPFATMPRLRLLSLRNNMMKHIPEKPFRSLRQNIAVLDVDGNPILCTCEMLWLSVWLEQSNSQDPGPRCANGNLLRRVRLDKSGCTYSRASNFLKQLPLKNEHGDTFMRKLSLRLEDDCDFVGDDSQQHSSPIESEFFSDQYIDFPSNDTILTPVVGQETPNTLAANEKDTSKINPNTTVLNYNLYGVTRLPQPQPSNQLFTFFGYPLPSLGVGGKFFGMGRNAESRSTQPPSKGRVRMYRPNDEERFLKLGSSYKDASSQNNFVPIPDEENAFKEYQTFRTRFKSSPIEKGGFSPMVPDIIGGGFSPMKNPFDIKKANESNQLNTKLPLPSPVDTEHTPDYEDSNDERLVPATTHEVVNSTQNANDQSITEDLKDTNRFEKPNPLQMTTDSPYTPPSKISQEILYFSTPVILPYVSSTSETILLIPPTNELDGYNNLQPQYLDGSPKQDQAAKSALVSSNMQEQSRSKFSLGRPLITKVQSPHIQNLPTAEGYFSTSADTALGIEVQRNEFVTAHNFDSKKPTRKPGMDWYYENYERKYNVDVELHSKFNEGILNKSADVMLLAFTLNVTLLVFAICRYF